MICYRPYKTQKIFIPFLIAADIGITVLTIFGSIDSNSSLFLPLILSLVLINFSLVFFIRICRISIEIDCNVIRVNEKKETGKTIDIDQFGYFYHAKDHRNHRYLVLSPNALTPKMANRIAAHCSISISPFYKETMCIYIDPLQDTSMLEKYISGNLSAGAQGV